MHTYQHWSLPVKKNDLYRYWGWNRVMWIIHGTKICNDYQLICNLFLYFTNLCVFISKTRWRRLLCMMYPNWLNCTIVQSLLMFWSPISNVISFRDQSSSEEFEKIRKFWLFYHLFIYTGPHSAVGNVSGYRCESDCRSRGREFDPSPVPYFCRDWSWNNFYGHSPPFRWIIQEGLLSITSESMCAKYWLTACSSLPRKKCG